VLLLKPLKPPGELHRKLIKDQTEELDKLDSNTRSKEQKSIKDLPMLLNMRSKTSTSTLANQEVKEACNSLTSKKLLTNGPNHLKPTQLPPNNSITESERTWKRREPLMKPPKLKPEQFGQQNSKLSSNHGKDLPTTSMDNNHKLSPPELRSEAQLKPLIEPITTLVKPLSMMSSNSPTILKPKEELSSKKLLLILNRKNKSTNNMPMLGTTRWIKSTSTKTPLDNGPSVLITEKPFSINGLMLKLMTLLPDKNSKKISSDTRDLLLQIKLLSEPPLKLNGQPNSKLSAMPLSNSTLP
jgi:hypothetical protein